MNDATPKWMFFAVIFCIIILIGISWKSNDKSINKKADLIYVKKQDAIIIEKICYKLDTLIRLQINFIENSNIIQNDKEPL